MRKLYCLVVSVVFQQITYCQPSPVNRQLFFLDDNVIEATLTTDIKKLKNDKKTPSWQPANITIKFSDTSIINEPITLQPRGIFRKDYCDMASLMLNFKSPAAPLLSPLKKLKLVGGCRSNSGYDILLLKEYLVYKIYNFISIMSFKVRLMHMTYKDSQERVKSYSQYAFLIEDMKDLAERNNCVEKKRQVYGLDAANRQQFNLVCLFDYMIGNTDWSMRQYHNVKLIVPKNDTLAAPYVIPYDFDFSGIVDADYASPNEDLPIKTVSERLYRGFPRTMEELQVNIDLLKDKKSSILFYLNNFPLLSSKDKKNMIKYLESFYKTLDNKKDVKSAFIINARKE